MNNKLYFIILLVFITLGVWIRISNLGYSDFQGDEAKVINSAIANNNIGDFFTSNSKAPGQYLITKLIFNLNDGYFFDKEFLLRLPFTLAGIFSLLLIYVYTNKLAGKEAAIYSLLIFSLNGFAIAFSRILQYQSIMILCAILSSLCLYFYFQKKSPNYLILTSLISLLGLLFHYDALSFIIPQSVILLIYWYNNRKDQVYYYFIIISFAILIYLPLFGLTDSTYTLKYLLEERITSQFSYDSIFYSYKLSYIYNSKEYLIAILFLMIYGAFILIKKSSNKYLVFLLIFSILILTVLRLFNESPRRILQYPSILLVTGLIVYYIKSSLTKTINYNKVYIMIWLLFSLLIYLYTIEKPLTHIYTIIMPLSIILGIQLKSITYAPLKLVVISLILINVHFTYKAFLENGTEYPWQEENYIMGSMYKGIAQGEVVRGIFGFPYYRNLNQISQDIRNIGQDVTSWGSNIKSSRLEYYTFDINKGIPGTNIFVEVKNSYDYISVPKDLGINYDIKYENNYYIIYVPKPQ